MNRREWRHGARIIALCPRCENPPERGEGRRLLRFWGSWYCPVHDFIHYANRAPTLAVQQAMFRDDPSL